MNLNSFKPMKLTNGPSSMTIAKSGISFSQTAVYKMEKAEYVKLLVDRDDKMVAIQKTTKDDPDATPFYKSTRKIVTAKWNYSELKNMFNNLMNWDTSQNTYKVMGEYLEDEKALVFDLKKANTIHK